MLDQRTELTNTEYLIINLPFLRVSYWHFTRRLFLFVFFFIAINRAWEILMIAVIYGKKDNARYKASLDYGRTIKNFHGLDKVNFFSRVTAVVLWPLNARTKDTSWSASSPGETGARVQDILGFIPVSHDILIGFLKILKRAASVKTDDHASMISSFTRLWNHYRQLIIVLVP